MQFITRFTFSRSLNRLHRIRYKHMFSYCVNSRSNTWLLHYKTNNIIMENNSLDELQICIDALELHIIFRCIGHPLTFTTALIQMGHEPIRPTIGRLYYFGNPSLFLPNKFVYLKHIYDIDGLSGCFRGLKCDICLETIMFICNFIVFGKVFNRFSETINNNEENGSWTLMKSELIGAFVSIVVSHPLYVLMYRKMAQFIGRETEYSSGILQGLYKIAKEEGISGWFAGFVPRIFGQTLEIVVFYSVVHIVSKYFARNRRYRFFITLCATSVANSFGYPFCPVSVCMAINNSGLNAGSPPLMPHYKNWVSCYSDLSRTYQLHRGMSAFWRPFIPSVDMLI